MRRRFFCLAGGLALCGCAGGAVTPIPAVGSEAVARAAAEIEQAPPPSRRELAEGEVTRTLDRIERRLNGPARALCAELGVGRCDWTIEASRSRQLNAAAYASGRVTVNRGVFEYAQSEAEVALVVAHELAHQIANHPLSGARDAETGAGIGAMLGAALVLAAAAGGARATPGQNRRVIEDYGAAGARLGNLAFSKEQEKEADRLGQSLLWRAGYDVAAARGFLVTMARLSHRRESGLFDTHPAGPERLAAFDATLAELRATGGAIPLRAG
jgi:predicted Zn-dependent protease